MIILEENFKCHLEAFASELFIYIYICILGCIYCTYIHWLDSLVSVDGIFNLTQMKKGYSLGLPAVYRS